MKIDMAFIQQRIATILKTFLLFAFVSSIVFKLVHERYTETHQQRPQCLPNVSSLSRSDTCSKPALNGLSDEELQEMRVKNYRGEGKDPMLYYFMPRPYKVNSYNNTFIFDGKQICESKDPYILVIVPSVIAHVQRRKAIRSTWASPSISQRWLDGTPLTNVKVLFLFGETDNVQEDHEILQKENQLYGDIVQARFHDSYRNLTTKMITALCWIRTYCPMAEYVLKADEDTFVHLPNMIKLIQKLNFTDSFIGMRFDSSVVLREGPLAVSYGQYPMETYPPYILGNFYAFSTKMVSNLCFLSEYFPYVPVEDAFVTGILRTALGARLEGIGNECFLLSTCHFMEGDKVAVTNVIETDLYGIWNTLNNKSLPITK